MRWFEKVMLFLIVLGVVFGVIFALQSSGEPRYILDTRNHNTLQASIVHYVKNGVDEAADYTRFYHVLQALENDYEGDLDELLTENGFIYRSEPRFSPVYTKTRWHYQVFDEYGAYWSGFDEEHEIKQLHVTYWTKNSPTMPRFIAGDGCLMPKDFVEVIAMVSDCLPERYGAVYDRPSYIEKQEVFGTQFTRYFDHDQTEYGYDHHTTPTLTFQYRSRLAGSPTATITLIDDDKMLLSWTTAFTDQSFAITRAFHYQRNDFNQQFPLITDDIDMLGSSVPAFFHQLSLYDGDTSQLNNIKVTTAPSQMFNGVYLPDVDGFQRVSSEAIYQPRGTLFKRVDHPLNMGSFNFSEGVSREMRGHFARDVYPYLIWGNHEDDPSTLRERLIWDYASVPVFGDSDLRTVRGSSLYTHESAGISSHLSKEDVIQEDFIDMLERVLNP